MINSINNQYLSLEQRRDILKRAQNSQPFFQLLTFELLAEAQKKQQYSAKTDVNKPYYFTELKGNFGEVFQTVNTFFNISLWSVGDDKSLWGFLQGLPLPSGLVATEARFNTAFANQIFDDRQSEYLPRLIRANDRIIAEIAPLEAKLAPDTVKICLSGYYIDVNTYINDTSVRGINEALENNIRYELWKVTVNTEGQITHKFNNDRYARIILGLGVVDKTTVKADLANSTVLIRDTARDLRFSNIPLPIEFIAPRLTALRDTHIYYLPIEYLMMPFTSLQMDFDTELNGGNGFEFVMLTRTV